LGYLSVKRLLRVLPVVLLAVLFLAGPVAAVEEWAQRLNSDMMSPYCPGRTLTDCPSPQAAELRAWVREQERLGRTREDVEAQLERLYGEVVRSAPRAQGWGLTAYLIPAGAMLAGAVLVVALLARRRAPSGDSGATTRAPTAVDPELEAIVDRELRNEAP
jgi:cytochrome c-type biogenesis protein CcmH/NrfF